MTWKSNERSSSDYDYQQGSSLRDDGMEDRARNARDLSSDMWKRDSGCGSGGCACGCCHGRTGRPDRPSLDDPKVEAGIKQISQILQDLGIEINLPTLWPRLGTDSNHPTDSTERTRSIDMSNGDTLTLGARGETGPFKLVDKDGMPVRAVKTIESMATDSPVQYVLSNGAIYRSRGGWNHDESITWPNGDVVRFSDTGKFQSYEPGKNASNDNRPSDLPYPPYSPNKPHDSSEQDAYIFSNGDRFVTTAHGWQLYTADGMPVTKGTPDTSAMDATRIPLSNGATLISGGWGVDTISYPGGEHISFSKDGTLRTVNGQPA
ncbi:MAG: hypothetical protein JST89_18075 [Cyanobacteria bacterium SZAS-4]|nr:hypothetical protein [Cyanobacteria bacterium SZAS-4]